MTGRLIAALALGLVAIGALLFVGAFGLVAAFAAGCAAGAAAALLAGHWNRAVSQAARLPEQRGTQRPGAGMAMLDALPDPVISLSRRANVISANRAARQAFPALGQDQPLSFVLRDPHLLETVQTVLDKGGEERCALSFRTPVERAFDCRIMALADAERQQEAVAVLVMTDVTEQRAVEAMRVDFVANASHELRTPLASILGFVETLQGPARSDTAARERFLAIMADQARRMARLVDDLLSLSRIELREHLAPSGTVDLTALLGQTAGALTGLARDRGVALSVEMPPGPVIAAGERDELISAFENLIENAIKYGKSGGKVDVSLTRGPLPAEAVIAVRDYGPGIAAEHLPRLTERFYRVDNALSRAEGGTGLGLALVKHTLNRHRGRLAIQSAPGKGATFIVSLPCVPAEV